ncbi:MAG TPA: hypothetical protein EYQ60_19185 [Myxococcales bacterium]|nr:hypothetical protein [Myxococcales bacterium]HIK86682.1 hypothetical protein [Myxococcales bacterium]
MFRRSSDPLALSEASLLALRPAMNAPVLNVKFLPVGPARAAIVAFAEEYGGMGLAIGVRSNEGGQIVVFKNQEPIDASVGIAEALETALSSAERLGFLFDEDMIEGVPGGQGRTQAMALWGRLMGELELPSAPQAIPSQPATSQSILEPPLHSALPKLSATDPAALLDVNESASASALAESSTSGSSADVDAPELLLDDVAAEDPNEIALDEISATQPDASQAPNPTQANPPVEAVVPPAQQLSKFRNAPSDSSSTTEDAGDESSNSGSSALGRIPLVRVRREGSKRVPFLSRLLSSF